MLFQSQCAKSSSLQSLCSEIYVKTADARCSLCRVILQGKAPHARKIYKKHSDPDRKRIVAYADWVKLASTLNINFRIAYEWIKSSWNHMFQKRGKKPGIISEQQIKLFIGSMQTLKMLKEKVLKEFIVRICHSILGNYLEGRLLSIEHVHKRPLTMNSNEDKMSRGHYILFGSCWFENITLQVLIGLLLMLDTLKT